MNKRPIYFSILAGVFTLLAISFPVQIAVLHSHSIFNFQIIFSKLTVLNYLTMLALLANALLTWQASPALRFTLPGLLLLTFWNNFVVGSYNYDFDLTQTSLATAGLALITLPLAAWAPFKMLLKNPHLRWWQRPKRVIKSVASSINPYVGSDFKAETFDISEGGIFIPFDSCTSAKKGRRFSSDELDVGSYTSVTLQVNEWSSIKATAVVVRKSEGQGLYPAGMGLEFINIDSQSKQRLKQFVNTH